MPSNKKNMPKEEEPMPEQDNAPDTSVIKSYDEISVNIKDIDMQITKLSKTRATLQKELDVAHRKVQKQLNKKKPKNSNPDSAPSGFQVANKIPLEFYNFAMEGMKKNMFTEEIMKELNDLNLTEDSLIPRTEITRYVYNYIKQNNLYEDRKDQNKRYYQADDAMITLFNMAKEDQINFFNFQKYITRLYKNVKEQVEEDVEEEQVVEEEEDQEEEQVSKKKAKNQTDKIDVQDEELLLEKVSKKKAKNLKSEAEQDEVAEAEEDNEVVEKVSKKKAKGKNINSTV